MRDEGSYVEFVSAQWPKLYRLAFLLAWSDTAVDELLRTALRRAYAAWDKAQRLGEPEAYVRRVLVRVAISEGRTHPRRRAVDDRQVPGLVLTSDEIPSLDGVALWPLVAVLPTRQRTVIVLRFFEDLSEEETARVLGCGQALVKSQVAAALDALRASLRTSPAGLARRT